MIMKIRAKILQSLTDRDGAEILIFLNLDQIGFIAIDTPILTIGVAGSFLEVTDPDSTAKLMKYLNENGA